MTTGQRQVAVRALMTEDKVRIMLMSLKVRYTCLAQVSHADRIFRSYQAGGVGLVSAWVAGPVSPPLTITDLESRAGKSCDIPGLRLVRGC